MQKKQFPIFPLCFIHNFVQKQLGKPQKITEKRLKRRKRNKDVTLKLPKTKTKRKL